MFKRCGKVRPAFESVDQGCPNDHQEVRCGCCCAQWVPVRRRWIRRRLPLKHRYHLFSNKPMVCTLMQGGKLWILVERYDPRMNKWYPVAPMTTRRKHLGCSVFNGFLYAVGGRDDATELSSAERYNPQANQWTPVVAMNSRRSGVSD